MVVITRPKRRRSRRWHVTWPAVVAYGDQQYPCTILDISEWGARIESLFSPLLRMPMRLQCDKFGSLVGELIWTRGKMAGMRFHISPAEVVRLLKPAVPWLDRRGQAALLTEGRRAPRPCFGRMPRFPSQGKPALAADALEAAGHSQTLAATAPCKVAEKGFLVRLASGFVAVVDADLGFECASVEAFDCGVGSMGAASGLGRRIRL